MPLTFSDIANKTKNISFTWQGDSVNLEYYPGHFTEKIIAKLQLFDKIKNSQDEAVVAGGFTAFNEVLIDLVKSWDIYDDQEKTVMFPLDVVRLSELPISFRSDVLKAINEDVNPNSQASRTN